MSKDLPLSEMYALGTRRQAFTKAKRGKMRTLNQY